MASRERLAAGLDTAAGRPSAGVHALARVQFRVALGSVSGLAGFVSGLVASVSSLSDFISGPSCPSLLSRQRTPPCQKRDARPPFSYYNSYYYEYT